MPSITENGVGTFETFFRLPSVEREQIIQGYLQNNGGIPDFDNSVIANGTLQALVSLGVDRDKMATFTVGPNFGEKNWDLGSQLKTKLIPSDYTNKDYIFFSVPTGSGTHSIPAVISTFDKKIYCLDSLASGFLNEACDQLKSAIKTIPELNDYTIITPPRNYPKQQSETWSCGVHSSANIVGIILNEEIKRGRVPDLRDTKLDSPGYSILSDSIIEVASGKGITKRSEAQTRDYFGVFILAFTRYGQEHTNRLVPLRLLRTQYREAARAIEKWADSPSHIGYKFSQELKLAAGEVQEVYRAINEGRTPVTINRSLSEFVQDFVLKNPDDPINGLLSNPDLDFLSTIPDLASMLPDKLKTSSMTEAERELGKISDGMIIKLTEKLNAFPLSKETVEPVAILEPSSSVPPAKASHMLPDVPHIPSKVPTSPVLNNAAEKLKKSPSFLSKVGDSFRRVWNGLLAIISAIKNQFFPSSEKKGASQEAIEPKTKAKTQVIPSQTVVNQSGPTQSVQNKSASTQVSIEEPSPPSNENKNSNSKKKV